MSSLRTDAGAPPREESKGVIRALLHSSALTRAPFKMRVLYQGTKYWRRCAKPDLSALSHPGLILSRQRYGQESNAEWAREEEEGSSSRPKDPLKQPEIGVADHGLIFRLPVMSALNSLRSRRQE